MASFCIIGVDHILIGVILPEGFKVFVLSVLLSLLKVLTEDPAGFGELIYDERQKQKE